MCLCNVVTVVSLCLFLSPAIHMFQLDIYIYIYLYFPSRSVITYKYNVSVDNTALYFIYNKNRVLSGRHVSTVYVESV